MIKNIKKFIETSAIEHKRYLRGLTYSKSVNILEKMLSSKIFSYMHFNDDDNPIALYKLAVRAKKKKGYV